MVAIIGGIVAVVIVLILVIAATTVTIFALFLRNRQAEFELKQK